MSKNKILSIFFSNVKRDRGNFWYNRKEMTYAIHCYRRALEYLISTNHDEDSHSGNAILESRMKVKNNLTAALMKTEAYDAALENVEDVLSHQPQNLKALYRKGKKILSSNSFFFLFFRLIEIALFIF